MSDNIYLNKKNISYEKMKKKTTKFHNHSYTLEKIFIYFVLFLETSKLPESKYLHVGNKNFYFDIGSNNRGVFLRVSEVNRKQKNVWYSKLDLTTFFLINIGSCQPTNCYNNTRKVMASISRLY